MVGGEAVAAVCGWAPVLFCMRWGVYSRVMIGFFGLRCQQQFRIGGHLARKTIAFCISRVTPRYK